MMSPITALYAAASFFSRARIRRYRDFLAVRTRLSVTRFPRASDAPLIARCPADERSRRSAQTVHDDFAATTASPAASELKACPPAHVLCPFLARIRDNLHFEFR